MNTETLFEEAIKLSDHKQLGRSIRLLLDEWVYFFILDKPGSNTSVSNDSVTYIITTGKDNPIIIPCIDDGEDTLGVLYFTEELAIKMAEFDCKVGKMKCRKALEMMMSTSDITAVVLQSTNQYNVRMYNEDIDRFLSK